MKRLLSLVFIFLIWTMFLDSVLLAETREILEETDSKRDTVETSSHSVSPHFSYQYYTNDEGSNDGSVSHGIPGALSNSQISSYPFGYEDRSAGRDPYAPFEVYSDPPAYGPPPAPLSSYGSLPPSLFSYGPPPAPIPSYGPLPDPLPSYGPPPDSLPSYGPPPDLFPSYGPPPDPIPAYGPPPGQVPSYGPPPDPILPYSSLPPPIPMEVDPYAQPFPLMNSYGPPSYGPQPAYAQPRPTGGFQIHQNIQENIIEGSNGDIENDEVESLLPSPPSAPMKGSIDYILIPLILIGIAGPIFVVLYVVLGSFEANLSPVLSRSQTWSSTFSNSLDLLKPAADSLLTSVIRALETHECMERVLCHVGNMCHDLRVSNPGFLQRSIDGIPSSLLREPYKKSMEALMSSIKSRKTCSTFKCP